MTLSDGRASADGDRVGPSELRLLAETNIIAVAAVTLDGIVDANDAFLSMLACGRDDVAWPIDWRAITPPEYAERDRIAIDELRLHGRCTAFEKEYWRKDGSRVPVLVGASLLESDPMRWICFMHDISTQKQTEEALRRAAAASETSSRAKDDFVNMLVHELRQPLGTMAAAVHIIGTTASRLGIGETLQRPLGALERQVSGLTQLTDELLLASRIVRGTMPLRRSQVDFAAIVRDVVDEERFRAETARVTLVLDGPPGPTIVSGDAMRLRHIVVNVVGNAIKYTRPGGSIQVTLVPRPSTCELRVRDTGIGIAADELPHVFEPFRRGTTEGRGFGLGLAVVRSIAEQHGGHATIASEGRDRGTEIVVTLPVVAAIGRTE